MNHRLRAIAFTLAGLIPVLAVAERPARSAFPAAVPSTHPDGSRTTADAGTVARLTGQLADESYTVRESASRGLAELGPGVVPPLRERLRQGDLHPESSARIRFVLDQFSPAGRLATGQFTQFGWCGGAANENNPGGSAHFRILAVERSDDVVIVRYEWQSGVLELRANPGDEHTLAGTWRQDNGSGAVELKFDAAGRFVGGQWNDHTVPDHWEAAFLR